MNEDFDISTARRVYEATKHVTFFEGEESWDWVDRFSLLTVPARARPAALFVHLGSRDLTQLQEILKTEGLATHAVSGIPEGPPAITDHPAETIQAFMKADSEREAHGRSLWVFRDRAEAEKFKETRSSSPGEILGYPFCCVRQRRQELARKSQAILDELVKAFGPDPATIAKAVLDGASDSIEVPFDYNPSAKAIQSRRSYPFTFHSACLSCLFLKETPTAQLNHSLSLLARQIDADLYAKLALAASIASRER